jgi:hypothetical protein
MFTTNKEAETICHTLSAPSKMPCYSYSTPASRCIIGKKMKDVKGSVCASCYASKGFYVMPTTKVALAKRFDSLTDPKWVDAMVFLIGNKEKSGFFRWHDSGDIQGVWHLYKIAQVAERLPHIQFWLPTREYKMVREFMDIYPVPKNLTIRLSALMVDGNAPDEIAKSLGLVVSGVSQEKGFTCPASNQLNKCGDCRACWNKNVYSVNYKKH